ncbi:hypothetical protein SEVIR_7G131700v4 [Setaria viridis]
MASPMLSATTAPLQSAGLSEFSGLRSSASLPLRRNATSDDFVNAVSFRTHAVGTSGGPRRAPTEAKLKVAINGFGRIGRNFLRCWHGRDDSPLEVIPTYVCGVNADQYNPDEPIISNASCTTNCLAPFVKVLDQKFGIIKGTMTTTHSYTGDQRLLDASHRDLRRARAAALNIVPTSTGAAKAVALVLPNLKGKLNGIALRVPTPNVSVVDLVVQVSKKTLAEEVNQAFRDSAANELAGILEVCDAPLVSVDFRCSDVSSTVDASLTMVMGDDMVKVIAWYDNEWGYSQRVVDLADIVANNWK